MCRCFLLTPKLLPDLEYSEVCSILNVMNGPWIEQPSKGKSSVLDGFMSITSQMLCLARKLILSIFGGKLGVHFSHLDCLFHNGVSRLNRIFFKKKKENKRRSGTSIWTNYYEIDGLDERNGLRESLFIWHTVSHSTAEVMM